MKLVKYPGVTPLIFVHGGWENLLTSSFLCLWNANLALWHEASLKGLSLCGGPKAGWCYAEPCSGCKVMGSVWSRRETLWMEGSDTLSLWHPHRANLCLRLHLETSSVLSRAVSADATLKNTPKTYKAMRWKVGRALWCRWSLIKCACGWHRNVCMVFALCPPQAAVPPEALYIFLTLPPHTLWLRSYPQPASTSDPRATRPSIIFLSLRFCSRGYFWHLNLLTLLSSFRKNQYSLMSRYICPTSRSPLQAPVRDGDRAPTTICVWPVKINSPGKNLLPDKRNVKGANSVNHTSGPISGDKEKRARTGDFVWINNIKVSSYHAAFSDEEPEEEQLHVSSGHF